MDYGKKIHLFRGDCKGIIKAEEGLHRKRCYPSTAFYCALFVHLIRDSKGEQGRSGLSLDLKFCKQ